MVSGASAEGRAACDEEDRLTAGSDASMAVCVRVYVLVKWVVRGEVVRAKRELGICARDLALGRNLYCLRQKSRLLN